MFETRKRPFNYIHTLRRQSLRASQAGTPSDEYHTPNLALSRSSVGMSDSGGYWSSLDPNMDNLSALTPLADIAPSGSRRAEPASSTRRPSARSSRGSCRALVKLRFSASNDPAQACAPQLDLGGNAAYFLGAYSTFAFNRHCSVLNCLIGCIGTVSLIGSSAVQSVQRLREEPSSGMDTFSQSISPISVEKERENRMLQLCFLRRQENARLPVARVPPEVLSESFVCVRDAHVVASRDGGAASAATRSCIYISHVSHFWRETALGAPRLWTYIDVQSPASACAFMDRARGAPLEIEMSESNVDSLSRIVAEAVRNHPGKISVLKLDADAFSALDSYLSVLADSSFNTLQILRIAFIGIDHYSLPNDITDGTFPKLEVLHLVSCNFDWQCALLRSCAPSLRQIYVEYCASPSGTPDLQRTQIRSVIHALRSMRHLKSCTLVGSLGGTAIDYTEDNGQSVLPALQDLVIDDNLFTCSALFRHLAIPQMCNAEIYVLYTTAAPPALVHNLVSFLEHSPVCTVELRIAPRYISVRAANRDLTLRGAEWHSHRNALSQIGAGLSAHVLWVSLRVHGDVATPVLRALFANSDAVTTELIFEGDTLEMQCLADGVGFLPRLHSVGFRSFDMGEVQVAKWAEALLERKKAGATLGVDFRGCRNVPMSLVEMLEAKLDWVVRP